MRHFSLYLLMFLCSSCLETMPKPRGLLRLEPPEPHYLFLGEERMPCDFEVSQLVSFEEVDLTGFNLRYNTLSATIFCTYQSITSATLSQVEDECYRLMLRSLSGDDEVTTHLYDRAEDAVYAQLFEIDGEGASPIQFIVTDRKHHFLRGAIYYQCEVDTDSLAPITQYLYRDVTQLIETFCWR